MYSSKFVWNFYRVCTPPNYKNVWKFQLTLIVFLKELLPKWKKEEKQRINNIVFKQILCWSMSTIDPEIRVFKLKIVVHKMKRKLYQSSIFRSKTIVKFDRNNDRVHFFYFSHNARKFQAS